MWPSVVRTSLHGSTGDEEYAKRLGEFLKVEFRATYQGLDLASAGSQDVTTYSFRVGEEVVAIELETYIGVTLVASRPMTVDILRAARAAGLPVPEMNDFHIIDYGHIHHGVLHHGTLSDLGGTPRATWSYDGPDGRNRTHDGAIDRDRFESLWNGFSSLDVFARNMVTTPDTPLDPVRSHVIGLRFRDDQGDGQCTFTVPKDEADVEFMAWLSALDPPYLAPRGKP